MSESLDLTGQRFGRLVVQHKLPDRDNSGMILWSAACDCGGSVRARVGALRAGKIQSCGCVRAEKAAVTGTMHRQHGLSKTPEYYVYRSMRRRCENPDTKNYADYGGRGIKVCERWKGSVENFITDMGPRPSDDHSIEREDNDGDYGPDNCRWATRVEQNSNTRRNVYYDFNGESLTMAEISRRSGVPQTTIRLRLDRGLSMDVATTK